MGQSGRVGTDKEDWSRSCASAAALLKFRGTWPCRLVVRILPSQGRDTGSNPAGAIGALCCRSTAEEARDWLEACGRETAVPQ
jgi:hypothetical protein